MRTRGYVSVTAGIFIIVLIGAIWFFIEHLLATHALAIPRAQAAPFFGKLYVAFAMIVVCGVLGVFNGVWQIRTGRVNRVVTFGTIVLFAAALFTIYQAKLPAIGGG